MRSVALGVFGVRPGRAAGEMGVRVACGAALLVGVGSLLFLPLFVVAEGYPAVWEPWGGPRLLVGQPWAPLLDPPQFGLMHAWVSSLMITALCLAVAVPLGYGIGLFVAEVAPPAVRTLTQPCLEVLAGIPSVVYGFFGYVMLLPLFERQFGMVTGESILAAALILAVMVLPFVATTSAEAFRSVPAELRDAAFAQGVSRWYVLRRVVIPRAAPGMYAAAILGFARAVGETLAVLMLTGNSVAVPTSILDRGQPLTALIATELGEAAVGSPKYHALFAAGLLLLSVTLAINAGIWTLKRRTIGRV